MSSVSRICGHSNIEKNINNKHQPQKVPKTSIGGIFYEQYNTGVDVEELDQSGHVRNVGGHDVLAQTADRRPYTLLQQLHDVQLLGHLLSHQQYALLCIDIGENYNSAHIHMGKRLQK